MTESNGNSKLGKTQQPNQSPHMNQNLNIQSTVTNSTPSYFFAGHLAISLTDNICYLPPHNCLAGLGIFIANLQVQPANHIYISATLQQNHSVIYAESQTIALAAVVLHRM
jgi:hypothetical protein